MKILKKGGSVGPFAALLPSGGGVEEPGAVNMELSSGESRTEAVLIQHGGFFLTFSASISPDSDPNTEEPRPPCDAEPDEPRLSLPSAADMCGSLHLAGGSGSGRPEHWRLTGADSLLYGHYHGFGDTAEDLSDSGVHLYHGS